VEGGSVTSSTILQGHTTMWKRRRTDELETVNLLDVSPVRLADWTEKQGRVVVIRPKSLRAGPLRWVDLLLYLLSARRVRLDPFGSFAWLQFDGKRSVGQVVVLLREEFGEEVEPAEERLGHLVRVFRREGFVAYPGWDEKLLSGTAVIGQPR
jgi:hypothetical protein